MTTTQSGKISVWFVPALIAGLLFVSALQALPAYPLRADPSHRYLLDTNNVPVWQGGETGWNLMSITTADADFYLSVASEVSSKAYRGVNIAKDAGRAAANTKILLR